MHTSFEDISAKEGSIGRFNAEGDLIWERPRTRHEAGSGYRRTVATFALGVFTSLPLALAMVLYFIKT